MQNMRHWICIQTNKGEEEKIDDDENGLLYADGAGSCGTDHWQQRTVDSVSDHIRAAL